MFSGGPIPVTTAMPKLDESYKSADGISISHTVNDAIAPRGMTGDAIARRTACLVAMLVRQVRESGKLDEHRVDDVMLSVRMAVLGDATG